MDTNEIIVGKIQRGENREKNISVLYHQNENLCYKAASQFFPLMRGSKDDLKQEASLAFILAVDTYNPDKGATFAAYAYDVMTWHLIRYMDHNAGAVRLPVYLRERIRAVNKAAAKYATAQDAEDIARAAGLSTQQVEHALAYEEATRTRSLNAPVSQESGALALEEVVPDPSDRIEELIEDMDKERLARILWSLVDDLGPRPAAALRATYQDGLTAAETADRMGVSRGTVTRTIQKALRELRKSRPRRELSPYLEARAETLAYKHGGLTAFQKNGTSSVEEFVLWMERREHQDDSDY